MLQLYKDSPFQAQLPRPHGPFSLSPTETTKPCKMLQSRLKEQGRAGLISLTDHFLDKFHQTTVSGSMQGSLPRELRRPPCWVGLRGRRGWGQGRGVFCTWGETPAPSARRFPATAAFLLGRRKRYMGRACVAGPEQPFLANFLVPGFPQEKPPLSLSLLPSKEQPQQG